MKVLYLSHTSTISGAERSLLELLAGLPPEVTPVVACPPGALASAARQLGAHVETVTGTDVSFRLHPWHTARGLALMAIAGRTVQRLVSEHGADLVHANSVRAGLIATASDHRRPPTIVHVRDCLPLSRPAQMTRHTLASRASLVVTNSRYTAQNFTLGRENARVWTIFNSVDPEKLDPRRFDREAARLRLGLRPSALALGVIAQITPWKAQDDAIEIVRALRDLGVVAHLLLAGGVKFTAGAARHDNAGYRRFLERLAHRHGLEEQVVFLGERTDVADVLRSLDLLLVPSWEEPFGRTVIEAMAMETAVVATCIGGPSEVIDHERDGLVLPPRDPVRWAEEVAQLLSAPATRAEMGAAGRTKVRASFTRQGHAEAMLEAYKAAAASP